MARAKTKKPKAKAPVARSSTKTRQLKTRPYRSFRPSKRIKHPTKELKGAFKIAREALAILVRNWRPFAGMLLVYLLLTIVIVNGFGVSTGIGEVKEIITDDLYGSSNIAVNGITLLDYLFSASTTPASEAGGVYQMLLLVMVSLAAIFTLRQLHAKKAVTARGAFYSGMYPVIPFILVVLVIFLQLLPLLIGLWLYSVVVQGGIAITLAEQFLWGMLTGLFALLSLYMVTSSVFALYIVTLPNMRPMQALRSARELVRYRRWTVMRKVLTLPMLLTVFIAAVVLPLIFTIPSLADWAFLTLILLALIMAHSYMYALYRELL